MTRRRLIWLAVLILVSGAMPVALYQVVIGSVPTVTVREAQELLKSAAAPPSDRSQKDSQAAVLVDVRTPVEFRERHVEGAVNWPLADIQALVSRYAVPANLTGKRLLLLCSSGVRSARATHVLAKLGVVGMANVRGGMTSWIAGSGEDAGPSFCKLRTASGDLTAMPFRESTPFEQYVAVASGFWVKPAYMLLSLVLVVILWRRRSPDLAALRWGLLFFFAGEFFCAVNYAVFNDDSFFTEYLHSFGMLLSFGFGTYAFLEGLDLRLVKYSDPASACAALKLCRACIKHSDAPCGLRRVFLLLIPAHIVLAFMALTAEPHMVSYNTRIFGTFYNFSHAGIYQLYEIRYCPVVAIVLFAASLLVLLLKKRDPVALSKVLFAAGMGPFAFGLLRLVLLGAYRDNMVWFAGWEEITEFLYIIGVAAVLWIFRHGLAEKSEKKAAGCRLQATDHRRQATGCKARRIAVP